MTNKNKRTNKKESVKGENNVAKTTTKSQRASSLIEPPPPPKGFFTQGQFTSLVFLGVGISRVLQVGDAIRKEVVVPMADDATVPTSFPNRTTTTWEASPACLQLFNGTAHHNSSRIMDVVKGEEEEEVVWTPMLTCLDRGLNVLLQYKTAVGWQVLAVIAALGLQCWHVEAWLLRLNTSLIMMAPISPSIVTMLLLVPHWLSPHSVYPHVIWAFLLWYLGKPLSKDFLPFSGSGGIIPPKAGGESHFLTTVLLLAHAGWFLFQGTFPILRGNGLVLLTTVVTKPRCTENAARITAWINDEFLTTTTAIASVAATNTPSSLVVALMWIVDQWTMALLYFFAWYYLSPSHQRGFLLYSGMIFLAVAMFQWTWLEDKYDNTGGGDPKIAHATLRQAVDWTMAVCGIFAGMAPSHTLDSVLSNKKRK